MSQRWEGHVRYGESVYSTGLTSDGTIPPHAHPCNAYPLARPPATTLQGTVSGIAVGGVVTSVLSFVSQLTAADSSGTGTHTAEDVAPAAFLYFSASAAVIAMCILGYSALPLLPYGR
jgi:hypothetical protein